MRISHQDFDLLQRTILELYQYRTMEALRNALPRIFLKVVPADHFSLACYEINPMTGASKMVDSVESDKRFNEEFVQAAEKLLIEHPFTKHFMSGGEMTAVKFSDFLTSEQLYRSVWREVVVRTLGFDRALSLPVASKRGTTAAISLGRSGKDFTERDRLMLNLIGPHFNQAQRNAALVTAQLEKRTRPLSDYGLTAREAEVGRWLTQGKTNPEIAIILGISHRTVEKHMERVLGKLAVENRATAAVILSQTSTSL
jgi:DNA-binding CsgD family transcriptional regulator